jgi:hypothetical protein
MDLPASCLRLAGSPDIQVLAPSLWRLLQAMSLTANTRKMSSLPAAQVFNKRPLRS